MNLSYTVELPTCVRCGCRVQWRQEVCEPCSQPVASDGNDHFYAGIEITTIFIPQGDEA